MFSSFLLYSARLSSSSRALISLTSSSLILVLHLLHVHPLARKPRRDGRHEVEKKATLRNHDVAMLESCGSDANRIDVSEIFSHGRFGKVALIQSST